MDHIGIDVHKRESQICILAEGGELIEQRIRTEPDRFAAVLGGRPRARILIEASTDSEWVARCLEGLGHEVIVADPNFAPMYATRTRKVKTDRRDARTLADANLLGACRPAHRLSDAQRHVRGTDHIGTQRDLVERTAGRQAHVDRGDLVALEGDLCTRARAARSHHFDIAPECARDDRVRSRLQGAERRRSRPHSCKGGARQGRLHQGAPAQGVLAHLPCRPCDLRVAQARDRARTRRPGRPRAQPRPASVALHGGSRSLVRGTTKGAWVNPFGAGDAGGRKRRWTKGTQLWRAV